MEAQIEVETVFQEQVGYHEAASSEGEHSQPAERFHQLGDLYMPSEHLQDIGLPDEIGEYEKADSEEQDEGVTETLPVACGVHCECGFAKYNSIEPCVCQVKKLYPPYLKIFTFIFYFKTKRRYFISYFVSFFPIFCSFCFCSFFYKFNDFFWNLILYPAFHAKS